jgi:hypothetical protein
MNTTSNSACPCDFQRTTERVRYLRFLGFLERLLEQSLGRAYFFALNPTLGSDVVIATYLQQYEEERGSCMTLQLKL